MQRGGENAKGAQACNPGNFHSFSLHLDPITQRLDLVYFYQPEPKGWTDFDQLAVLCDYLNKSDSTFTPGEAAEQCRM